MCVVQRKGKCGNLSAPTKCRRKTMLAVRKQIQVRCPCTLCYTALQSSGT